MTNRKFSLQNFEGGRALSREEMKNVLGGVAAAVGVVGGSDGTSCVQDSDCGTRTVTCSGTAHTYQGRCNSNGQGGLVCVYPGCAEV